MLKNTSGRLAIIALQLLVGALVTLGGFAFATFAIGEFGTALGLIHFSVGVTDLIVGFYTLRMNFLPRRILFVTNGVTIAYSAFSESLVQVDFLLPPSPSFDSLVGTVIATALSCVIISFLLSSR